MGPEPFWFGAEPQLLEVPMTWDFCGPLSRLGPRLAQFLTGPAARSVRLPAVLARLRLLEYIRLTPEGDMPTWSLLGSQRYSTSLPSGTSLAWSLGLADKQRRLN